MKSIDECYTYELKNLSSSNNEKEVYLSAAIEKKDFDTAKNILKEIVQELENKAGKHESIINSHSSYILNYQKEMSNAYLKIATIASLLNLEVAEKYFKEAITLCNNDPSVSYAFTFYLNANGEYRKAINLSHEIIKKFALSRKNEQYIYGNLGVFYKNVSDWNNSGLYNNKSLLIAQERNDIPGQIISKNNIAVLLNNKEKNTEAYNLLTEILPLINNEISSEDNSENKNSLRILKSDILTNIVISLRRISEHSTNIEVQKSNLEKALVYIHEAIDIAEMINEPIKIITNYGNASNIYKQLEQLENCERYIELALNKSLSIQNKKLIFLSRYNMSLLFIEQNKLSEAEDICLSLAQQEEIKHTRLLPDTYYTLAIIAYKKNNRSSSLKYCELARKLYQDLKLEKSLAIIEELRDKLK